MSRIVFLFLLFPFCSGAQFLYEFDQSIPVIVNGEELKMPWAGGINSAQYNSIDLNNDGTEDLILFDRGANSIATFLAIDNSYVFAPEYASLFPKEINNWLILKDYNCDGKKDIFTSSPFGIATFLNVSQDQLKWESDYDPVNTLGTNGIINLKINGDDVPAIVDLDNDGDLDILTFGFTGVGTLQYHENRSIENTGACGLADFVRTTNKWGDFQECGCGTYVYGTEQCPTGGKLEHAGGKSLLVFDVDGDDDYDIVIGEENCSQLNLLTNIQDNANPQMRMAVSFPENDPVNLNHFPAAYLEDINFDGVRDLLISSNFPYNNNFIDFENSSWLYSNSSTNSFPIFEFKQKNFLQEDMIDLGENATPCFFDYDGDNDLDLFLTQRGKYFSFGGYYSSVYLYENTGNRTTPIFELKNEDFLSLSDLKYNDLQLQFADLNADGTQDLIVIGKPTNAFSPVILYALNKDSKKLIFGDNQLTQLSFPALNFENHLFYDIDSDGFSDLLLGKSSGNLAYHRNSRNATSLGFELQTDAFYGIGTNFTNRNLVPVIGDLNGDQKVELITTDVTGALTIYEDFLNHLNAPKEGERENFYNNILNTVDTANLGNSLKPVIADLYSSGTPLIVLGTSQGGLKLLKNVNNALPGMMNASSILNIYPNPGTLSIGNGNITMTSTKKIEVQIISVLGKETLPPFSINTENPLLIPVKTFKAGMYIALAYENEILIDSQRFVIIK